jgi:hypothetical protein
MTSQGTDSEPKRENKVSEGSQVLFLFATGVLILWVAYRTFVMGSDAIAKGYPVLGIVGYVIGGTIGDLRTVALFIGVILLGRKLRKQRRAT